MINELLTHEDPWVREKASHINQLEEMHRGGEISTEEYVELLEDITRTEMVLDNNANVNGTVSYTHLTLPTTPYV